MKLLALAFWFIELVVVFSNPINLSNRQENKNIESSTRQDLTPFDPTKDVKSEHLKIPLHEHDKDGQKSKCCGEQGEGIHSGNHELHQHLKNGQIENCHDENGAAIQSRNDELAFTLLNPVGGSDNFRFFKELEKVLNETEQAGGISAESFGKGKPNEKGADLQWVVTEEDKDSHKIGEARMKRKNASKTSSSHIVKEAKGNATKSAAHHHRSVTPKSPKKRQLDETVTSQDNVTYQPDYTQDVSARNKRQDDVTQQPDVTEEESVRNKREDNVTHQPDATEKEPVGNKRQDDVTDQPSATEEASARNKREDEVTHQPDATEEEPVRNKHQDEVTDQPSATEETAPRNKRQDDVTKQSGTTEEEPVRNKRQDDVTPQPDVTEEESMRNQRQDGVTHQPDATEEESVRNKCQDDVTQQPDATEEESVRNKRQDEVTNQPDVTEEESIRNKRGDEVSYQPDATEEEPVRNKRQDHMTNQPDVTEEASVRNKREDIVTHQPDAIEEEPVRNKRQDEVIDQPDANEEASDRLKRHALNAFQISTLLELKDHLNKETTTTADTLKVVLKREQTEIEPDVTEEVTEVTEQKQIRDVNQGTGLTEFNVEPIVEVDSTEEDGKQVQVLSPRGGRQAYGYPPFNYYSNPDHPKPSPLFPLEDRATNHFTEFQQNSDKNESPYSGYRPAPEIQPAPPLINPSTTTETILPQFCSGLHQIIVHNPAHCPILTCRDYDDRKYDWLLCTYGATSRIVVIGDGDATLTEDAIIKNPSLQCICDFGFVMNRMGECVRRVNCDQGFKKW